MNTTGNDRKSEAHQELDFRETEEGRFFILTMERPAFSTELPMRQNCRCTSRRNDQGDQGAEGGSYNAEPRA